MRIAIQHTPGSYSDEWITFCKKNQIDFKIVCCYDNNIIEQLKDCDGLMWHWNHVDYKANLFARQLIYSLERMGIKTFPNAQSCWHYDDKVGQKYLLEAIEAPLVKSYVFYSKDKALAWLDQSPLPKVFKLRRGAGSINVKLIKTRQQAKRFINKAFGKGFKIFNPWNDLKDRLWKLKRDKNWEQILSVLKGMGRSFIPTEFQKFSTFEKGYIYFQDFVPNNHYDTRLFVIGNRCFGKLRYCRKNDFRASGSGLFGSESKLLDINAVKIAFETAKNLNTQSLAFDFVLDDNVPKIIEISYASSPITYALCQGYWDHNLVWYDRDVNPAYFMIEDFVNDINNKVIS
ncbi:MAG: ATP-grasp domain-containing protein [Ginsengibacter sp.]